MDVLIDLAGKGGAAVAPLLAFFLWRETLRCERLEASNKELNEKVEQLAERSLTAMLETKHTVATFGAIISANKQ
jgi:hypothetical protein